MSEHENVQKVGSTTIAADSSPAQENVIHESDSNQKTLTEIDQTQASIDVQERQKLGEPEGGQVNNAEFSQVMLLENLEEEEESKEKIPNEVASGLSLNNQVKETVLEAEEEQMSDELASNLSLTGESKLQSLGQDEEPIVVNGKSGQV